MPSLCLSAHKLLTKSLNSTAEVVSMMFTIVHYCSLLQLLCCSHYIIAMLFIDLGFVIFVTPSLFTTQQLGFSLLYPLCYSFGTLTLRRLISPLFCSLFKFKSHGSTTKFSDTLQKKQLISKQKLFSSLTNQKQILSKRKSEKSP